MTDSEQEYEEHDPAEKYNTAEPDGRAEGTDDQGSQQPSEEPGELTTRTGELKDAAATCGCGSTHPHSGGSC